MRSMGSSYGAVSGQEVRPPFAKFHVHSWIYGLFFGIDSCVKFHIKLVFPIIKWRN